MTHLCSAEMVQVPDHDYASQQPLLEPASWLLRGDYLRARFRPKDTLLPSDN
jgi:hypothetical protein